MKTILRVSGKCIDLFSAVLTERPELGGSHERIGEEYVGYVPDWFPNPASQNDGDYIILDIDLDTGKILNWKKPTKANLKSTFKV